MYFLPLLNPTLIDLPFLIKQKQLLFHLVSTICLTLPIKQKEELKNHRFSEKRINPFYNFIFT